MKSINIFAVIMVLLMECFGCLPKDHKRSNALVRNANNPILDVGKSGSWDCGKVLYPYYMKVGSTYFLYYAGCGSDMRRYCVGLATSDDGVNFKRITDGINNTSKVLALGPAGTWDDFRVWGQCVVYDNDTFYMFYAGRSNRENVGVATSHDGKNWTKYTGNPILRRGGTGWRSYHLCHMDVVWDLDSQKWIMLTSGMDGAAHGKYEGHESIAKYYCSKTEFPYIWHEDPNNPVINFGTQNCDTYHVLHPKIYPKKVNGKWFVYYTSRAIEDGTKRTISRATTRSLYDGLFTKDPNNPIVEAGNRPWENGHVFTPSLKQEIDGKYMLYYTGCSSSKLFKIGLIEADNINDVFISKTDANCVVDEGFDN